MANRNKYMKLWHTTNKEWEKEYRQLHRERLNENVRRYSKGNQTKKNKLLKIWRHNNPLNVRVHRLRRKELTATLTVEIVQRVYEDNIKKYGTLTCYLCENPITFGNDTIEHKIPLSRGGSNIYENLGVACSKCNSLKGTKTETEYRKERSSH